MVSGLRFRSYSGFRRAENNSDPPIPTTMSPAVHGWGVAHRHVPELATGFLGIRSGGYQATCEAAAALDFLGPAAIIFSRS